MSALGRYLQFGRDRLKVRLGRGCDGRQSRHDRQVVGLSGRRILGGLGPLCGLEQSAIRNSAERLLSNTLNAYSRSPNIRSEKDIRHRRFGGSFGLKY